MGKGKLEKFAELATFNNVFQYPYSVVEHVSFALRGCWHKDYFKNTNPITLELGCGKGEYTVELARRHPERNFIGVDIKGARLWTGAKQAIEAGLTNVAFLRTNIEIIDRFFSEDEVDELWLTFSDPQMKNVRKRLTSTFFLERYRHFLTDQGAVNVKTDSNFLFTYTKALLEVNGITPEAITEDLYGETAETYLTAAAIQTYYEQMWLDRGLNIRFVRFRLPRLGDLSEPDIEIELDEYRSYNRHKRSSLDTRK